MPLTLVGAVAPAAAGSGPLAPIILGGAGAATLIAWLLTRGDNDQPPPPTPTNPITGQPVPVDPQTGQVWGLDTQNGLPSELTQQIWGLEGPAGTGFTNLTPDNYVQQGLPFWAANRFKEMSDQLGGWDNLTKWLYDRGNWATALGILTNPWGQSTYDKAPEGVEAQARPPAAPEQPAAPEGQITQTPEGTPPNAPTTPEGQAAGDPTWTTTVGGNGLPSWALPAAGLGAGIGGLAAILNGGQAPQEPTLVPSQGMPQGQTAAPPNFSTTVTGQMPPDPAGTGGGQPTIVNGVPTFSTTVTAPMPSAEPTLLPNGGLIPGQLPPPPQIAQPQPSPLPTQLPQTPVPQVPTPPATGASTTQPNVPTPEAAGTGGTGGLTVPPAYPSLGSPPPISSLFGPSVPQALVPGLNAILSGRF